MSSDNGAPKRDPSTQGTPSARRTGQLPAIRVDTEEANALGFSNGSGSTPPVTHSAFPSSPTPTLGGAAIRHSQGGGQPLLTFTASGPAGAGSFALTSNLGTPSTFDGVQLGGRPAG